MLFELFLGTLYENLLILLACFVSNPQFLMLFSFVTWLNLALIILSFSFYSLLLIELTFWSLLGYISYRMFPLHSP